MQSGTLAELRHLTRTAMTVETDRSPTGPAELPGVHDLRSENGRLRFDVDTESLGDVLRHLVGCGVRTLTSTPPTLEELFLRHYGDELAAEDVALPSALPVGSRS